MLLSESVYKRIPLFWMIVGLLFLLLGWSSETELQFTLAYFGLAVFCIGRSVWIYQARWKFYRRNQMSIVRDTMVIKHPIAENLNKRR